MTENYTVDGEFLERVDNIVKYIWRNERNHYLDRCQVEDSASIDHHIFEDLSRIRQKLEKLGVAKG